MVFRGQSTPTEYKEGTIRIDFLLTAKEGGAKRIYICYLPDGRSVLGKTVPEVLDTGLVGHSFPQYGPALARE